MSLFSRRRVFRGLNSRTLHTRPGLVLDSAATAEEWLHPWSVLPYWVDFAADPTQPVTGKTNLAGGEWRAQIVPGFVNGRDVFIEMPSAWIATNAKIYPDFGINPLTGQPFFSDFVFAQNQPGTLAGTDALGLVPLTAEEEPYLVLDGFRNPIASSGVVANEDTGELDVQPGTGYPPFFVDQGVRPPDAGGVLGQPGTGPVLDRDRTREIRAMDIVLSQPRLGTQLNVTPTDFIGNQQFYQLDTTFIDTAAVSTGSRAKLRATAQFQPPGDPDISALFGLLLNNGDPQVDEIVIATVWLVSPPDADADATPDATWDAFVQHFVFWNLNHATKATPPGPGFTADTFVFPTATGALVQPVIDGILATVNTMQADLADFIAGADARGAFWSV